MPEIPCHIIVTPTRNGEDGDSRPVTDRSRHAVVYETFAEAKANIFDAGSEMDTLSRRTDYHVDIVSLDGEVRRRMHDDLVTAIWEDAEDDRYHNCIGARLRRGEAVAI